MRTVFLAVLLAIAACSGGTAQLELHGNTMGTQFSVKLPGGIGGMDEGALRDSIVAALDDDEYRMSTYRPDSEVSRFNSNPSTDWQAVSADLCRKVEESLAISLETGGAFDITVGPLVNLWGFGPGRYVDEPPGDDDVAALMDATGYEKLHADCTRPAIRKDVAGLMLDLSAIGKGYAADRVGSLLASLGFDDFLVEVGGELAVRGLNADGDPWAIGIEAPLRDERRPHTIVHLSDTGMATSGDYRNFFESGGRIYSHTIDSRTGRPVTHKLASVTVVDAHAYRADALATALLVMGPDEGLAFAERRGLSVLMLIRADDQIQERQTAAFAKLRDMT